MQCLVSACLLGQACRYDGASKPHAGVQAAVQTWQREGVQVTAVCPEELGDLGTPRPGAHLVGGDGHAVLAGQASVQRVADAGDVTAEFVAGAQRAAAVAPDAQFAVLKSFSPSCGCGWTEIDGLRQAGDVLGRHEATARNCPWFIASSRSLVSGRTNTWTRYSNP